MVPVICGFIPYQTMVSEGVSNMIFPLNPIKSLFLHCHFENITEMGLCQHPEEQLHHAAPPVIAADRETIIAQHIALDCLEVQDPES